MINLINFLPTGWLLLQHLNYDTLSLFAKIDQKSQINQLLVRLLLFEK